MFRRLMLPVVCLLVLLAGAPAGCAPSIVPTPASQSTPTSAEPGALVSATEDAAAGSVMGLEMRDGDETVSRVKQARATGATWARYQVRWDRLEPARQSPPAYDWTYYDISFGELAENGFRVVATIRENPTWAASTRCGPLNAEGQKGFSEFLTALVRRYGAKPYGVKHWEIYNEPDNADPVKFPELGGCWGKDPAGYAAALKLAHDAIKAVDPEAVIVFGGIALEKFDDSPFNVDFTKQVLEAGGGAYFDWMNFHYYPAFSYRWEKFGVGVQGKAAYIRKMLKDAGVEKPLACSEIGQPSAGPAAEGYSDALQMRMVVREQAQAILADLKFSIWYGWMDKHNDARAYGLVDPDGKPKPARGTYALLVEALKAAHFEGLLGRQETGSDKIEAYRFTLAEGRAKTLVIAWRKDEGAPMALPIQAGSAIVTDVEGKSMTVTEGQAGDLNSSAGALSVGVGPSPLLIYYGGP